MKLNINVTIEGSSNECVGFAELLLGDQAKVDQLIARLGENDLTIETNFSSGISDQQTDTNPFIHVSWSSIHLYDLIQRHHTDERSDSFIMTEAELEHYRLTTNGATFNKDQLSRIIGGARQTTNKLNIPPILEINKITGIKEFCASKKALPHFNAYMKSMQWVYHKELKERGHILPGTEQDE